MSKQVYKFEIMTGGGDHRAHHRFKTWGALQKAALHFVRSAKEVIQIRTINPEHERHEAIFGPAYEGYGIHTRKGECDVARKVRENWLKDNPVD